MLQCHVSKAHGHLVVLALDRTGLTVSLTGCFKVQSLRVGRERLATGTDDVKCIMNRHLGLEIDTTDPLSSLLLMSIVFLTYCNRELCCAYLASLLFIKNAANAALFFEFMRSLMLLNRRQVWKTGDDMHPRPPTGTVGVE